MGARGSHTHLTYLMLMLRSMLLLPLLPTAAAAPLPCEQLCAQGCHDRVMGAPRQPACTVWSASWHMRLHGQRLSTWGGCSHRSSRRGAAGVGALRGCARIARPAQAGRVAGDPGASSCGTAAAGAIPEGRALAQRQSRQRRHCLMQQAMHPLCSRGRALSCGVASAKHFQKRSVSSAAAEQTVVPSGDCARCRTRDVWPDISATLAMDGYFHRHSWFWLKPWLLRISRSCRLHCNAQTCRPAAHIRQADALKPQCDCFAARLIRMRLATAQTYARPCIEVTLRQLVL